MALPIWALYYKKLYADPELTISQEKFERPKNLSIQIDCDEISGENENVESLIEEVDEF